jgi:hypothetical protein
MLVTPAIAEPLALDGTLRGVVRILAAVVGFAGSALVFGGLIIRVVLRPGRAAGDEATTLDDALLAMPHMRAAWLGLALLWLAFTVGAVWCLALAFGHDRDERFADALLLGLPAAALGWAAWRARVMWTAPADRESLSSP